MSTQYAKRVYPTGFTVHDNGDGTAVLVANGDVRSALRMFSVMVESCDWDVGNAEAIDERQALLRRTRSDI